MLTPPDFFKTNILFRGVTIRQHTLVDITLVFMGFTNQLTTRGPHTVGILYIYIYIYIYTVSLFIIKTQYIIPWNFLLILYQIIIPIIHR